MAERDQGDILRVSQTVPVSFNVLVTDATAVTARRYPASTDSPLHATLILAHGAGAPQASPFMTRFASGLADRGLEIVTFDFVYIEQRRRAPDRAQKLEACYRAVIDATRTEMPTARPRLLVGGKSMGGRIASQVVAKDAHDLGVGGLVLLGYPLHPPGRPEKRRDAHLPDIDAPILFVQGSRDTFGTESELRPVVESCRRARLHAVEGGDHSLKVRGKGAPPQEEIYAQVMDAIAHFVTSVAGKRPQRARARSTNPTA